MVTILLTVKVSCLVSCKMSKADICVLSLLSLVLMEWVVLENELGILTKANSRIK